MSNANIYNTNVLTTKIKIKASQLNKNFKKYILQKLKKEYEGIYTKFGLIKSDSIEILKVSLGNIEQNGFEGNIIYHVEFKSQLCNPTVGSIILCNVVNLNNFGILCTAKDEDKSIIEVIVPKKSLAIKSDVDLSTIKQNDKVFIEIMGKKQELNDTKIKCIGKITKTKSRNTDNVDLIQNNQEDIIIETNDYEDIDDEDIELDEDIDLEEGASEEDENENEEDEVDEEEEEDDDDDDEESQDGGDSDIESDGMMD